MKGLMKVIAAGTVITISLGCITVFGAGNFGKRDSRAAQPVSVQAQSVNKADFKGFKHADAQMMRKGPMGNKPERAELTEEEKAAKLEEMKAELTKKLEAGEISQEDYDKILEHLESGKGMQMQMRGKRPMGNKPEKAELTEEEKAAKLEEMKAELAKKLEAGEISQEDYDKILEHLESGKGMQMQMRGKGMQMQKGARRFNGSTSDKADAKNTEI